jgi:hypothetical protein
VSVPRFLADADVRKEIVLGLKLAAPDAEFVSVRDIGMGAAPDPEILSFAAREGWIVVSHDVHTMTRFAYERVALGEKMPGLFIVPQSRATGPTAEALFEIWAASDAEEWDGQVNFLPLTSRKS